MKKFLLFLAIAIGCGMQLLAQESSVSIKLNNEERFRFDGIRLKTINPGFHVMIGDSTGMDDIGNSQTMENTFIGHRAGNMNYFGSYNTFLGSRAGENHISGDNNIFLGAYAGFYDTDGMYNVFLGYSSGYVNTTGNKNTFVGATTGINNSTGKENSFFGTSAGGSNYTGDFNTYIGRKAGLSNQEGSGNVCLGYFAGANEMGSNKLYIANSGTSLPLIYGEFDNSILQLNGEVRVVDHDVYINDPSKGIILTSPDGSCWRVTVSDAGALSATPVSCP